jgi:hypothetical protein
MPGVITMTDVAYKEGMLVRHPAKPEWGLGKILEVRANRVTVHFRSDVDSESRVIATNHCALEIATEQSDPILDNLPLFRDGRFEVKAKRVTFEDGIRRFLEIFPGGFADPNYLGSNTLARADVGERNYKWEAHVRYVEALGNGKAEVLLSTGNIEELTQRALMVTTKQMNLLSPFEAMAFRDGLMGSRNAAVGFFAALCPFIEATAPREDLFASLVDALEALPVERGKARVATWPVVTLLPFLARPDRFMFLKPEPTSECAARMRFDLQYTSELRWLTYKKLMHLGSQLLERLRPLGARDYIDVQSFIWVIAKY